MVSGFFYHGISVAITEIGHDEKDCFLGTDEEKALMVLLKKRSNDVMS